MTLRVLLACGLVGFVVSSTHADDWTQWRGPTRDNKVSGFTVPATWPKTLMQKWKVNVGDGIASPALVGDQLFAYARQGNDEVLTCINVKTGKEEWKEKHPGDTVSGPASGFKGPRSSVAVADGKVVTFGVGGTLTCWDAKTGKVNWRKETKAKPRFATSCSPMVHDGLCIIHTGSEGRGELAAYDLKTGDVKWRWTGDGPSYGSPILANIHEIQQVVILTERNLIGVAAADGKLLWKTALSTGRYQTCTPIVAGKMVVCAGNAFDLEKTTEGFTAKSLWKERAPHNYNSPTFKDDFIYGFSGMGRNSKLYCQDAKTGKVIWEDSTSRGECSFVLDAGSVLIGLSSDSNLFVFKPGGKEFQQIASYKVADSGTWADPILSGNRIIVKDKDSVILWTLD